MIVHTYASYLERYPPRRKFTPLFPSWFWITIQFEDVNYPAVVP